MFSDEQLNFVCRMNRATLFSFFHFLRTVYHIMNTHSPNAFGYINNGAHIIKSIKIQQQANKNKISVSFTYKHRELLVLCFNHP
jgi:1,4-alpha-glucan branching enzyme